MNHTKTYTIGWDAFTPDPGAERQMKCRVCGQYMDVERDCNGPGSFVAVISGCQRPHDLFTCPDAGKSWHSQAMQLRKKAEETPSKFEADKFTEEADLIIRTKKCTKENWSKT